MRSARVYSVALATLFVVAIGLKVRLRGLNESQGPDVRARISSDALWNGFWVDALDKGDSQMDRLAVWAGDCRALVVFASPLGWHRDGVKRAAAPGDSVFFLYRGARYDDQPMWKTVSDHYLQRLWRILGEASLPHPVLGVVASPGCRLGRLDWLERDGPAARTPTADPSRPPVGAG